MKPPNYQIRRATVEDLSSLRHLWKEAMLAGAELERHLTEFQVVVSEMGELLGAIGLHIIEHEGKLHSEAFLHPEYEDEIRPQLWERLEALAHNHSLVRFWTLEDTPFWRHYVGFKDAAAQELQHLPTQFGERQARWLVFSLREGHPAALVEEHIAIFKGHQQDNIDRLRRQAQRLKSIATWLAVLLFVAVILAGIYLLRQRLPLGR
jgi:N-acetylglutamate synthase-like GNAT family acetyltransferase